MNFQASRKPPQQIPASVRNSCETAGPDHIQKVWNRPVPPTTDPGCTQESFGPPYDSVNISDVIRRLWQGRVMLLCAALAGLGAALLFTMIRQPVYRARTSIRLEPFEDKYQALSDVVPPSASSSVPNEAYLQNELKVLESDTLARRVANQLHVQTVQTSPSVSNVIPGWVRNLLRSRRRIPSPDELALQVVRRSLTVRSSLKSQVVEIFFDALDPAVAAQGANAVVTEYIALNREARIQAAEEARDWLKGQIAEMQTKLRRGNDKLRALAGSTGLVYTADQSLLSEQSVREVEEQLSRARADRTAKQSRYETAVSNPPQSLPNSADSGLLREYEGTLAGLRRDLAQLQLIYTPSHDKVKDVQARIAQVEAAAREERQRMIDRMRAEYEAADRLEQRLEASYNEQKQTLQQQTADSFRYNLLKRDLDNAQQIFNALSQKSNEATIASALNVTSVRVIDVATPPLAPYSPSALLNCSVGFSGGLFLAVIVVLMRQRSTWPESYGDSKTRELGVIPSAKDDPALLPAGSKPLRGWGGDLPVALLTAHGQGSLLAECFRAAATSVRFSPDVERRRNHVLALTSIQPGEGKTSIASNMGIALTESGGRVLLVDADLRRPRLHTIFGMTNDMGLTDLLEGNEQLAAGFDRRRRITDIPGLFVITSGPRLENPARVLGSARLPEFLAQARAEFDYVLIDTPPAGLFSDARIVSRTADSVIFVIHADKTGCEEFEAICRLFSQDGTHVLGTIVNHGKLSKQRRSYSGYSYTGA